MTGPRRAQAELDETTDWPRYRSLCRDLLGRPLPKHRLDWWGPLGFALMGAILRIVNLGNPRTLVFDEAYYVRQAYSMLMHGVELRIDPKWGKESNKAFENGTFDVFTANGDLVVHPPLGKWLIALGQGLFGVENAWSWRIVAAVFGVAAIIIVGRATRRLTGSAWWGTFAAGMLAFEGGHFTHSRTGVLDIFLATFVLAAFAALLVDRDRAREQLAWRMASGAPPNSDFGPVLGWRPWRLAAGVLLGCAVATKWSGAVFLAVFGLMTVLWDAHARRTVGVRRWFVGALLRDAPTAFIAMVGTSLLLYVVSWAGWFASSLGYDRHWGEQHPALGWEALIPNAIRSWVHYHEEIWRLATSISSEHAYATPPWTWMLQLRPTLFYKVEIVEGHEWCPAGVGTCIKTVNSIGSLPVWWVGLLAVAALIVLWLGWRTWKNPPVQFFPRDWRIGAALSGLAAGYLPWWFSGDRTIYAFYTVAFVPWVIMSIAVALDLIAPQENADRKAGIVRWVSIGLLVLAVLQFVWFYPVYTALPLSKAEWLLRGWLPGWR